MGDQIANRLLPSGWHRVEIPRRFWYDEGRALTDWLRQRPSRWALKIKGHGRVYFYVEDARTAFEFKMRWG